MVLLKLLIVPVLLAGISAAARRWGPQVGGLLAGFPLITGPILYFIYLEQGARFAARAAQGSVLAVLASVAFGLVYSHGSRGLRWPLAIALSLASWLVATISLARVPASLPLATGLSVTGLAAAPFLLPRSRARAHPAASLPRAELAARMVAGAALVVAATTVAAAVGTRWAGLIAMFPVMGIVLGVFSHRRSGAVFVADLFRGLFRGYYSFTAFCVSLSLLLVSVPAASAFAASVILALVVQAAVYWLTARDTPSEPTPLRGAA